MGIRGRGRGNDEEACGLTTLSVMGGIALRGAFSGGVEGYGMGGWGWGDAGSMARKGREGLLHLSSMFVESRFVGSLGMNRNMDMALVPWFVDETKDKLGLHRILMESSACMLSVNPMDSNLHLFTISLRWYANMRRNLMLYNHGGRDYGTDPAL